MNRFCRYELRTTDVAEATSFYTDVLGARFWDMSTSARNRVVNATLPRMFGMSMARSEHVLHFWTDELD